MQLIVEDTANRFWRVWPAPDGIDHAWAGRAVKRVAGGRFADKARSRVELVRKAGCRIVAKLGVVGEAA